MVVVNVGGEGGSWVQVCALDLGVGPVGLNPQQGLVLGPSGVRQVSDYFQQSLHLLPPDLEVGSAVRVEPVRDEEGREDSNQIMLVVGGQHVPVPRSGAQGLLFLARVAGL